MLKLPFILYVSFLQALGMMVLKTIMACDFEFIFTKANFSFFHML